MAEPKNLSLWNKIVPHEDAEHLNRAFYGEEYDREVKRMKMHAKKCK